MLQLHLETAKYSIFEKYSKQLAFPQNTVS